MAARWDERVRAAELARFELSIVGRLAAWLGLSSAFVQRVRFTKLGLLSLAWAFLPRRIKLVAAGLVTAWVVVAVGLITAVAVAFAQLA
jgi:hypothetical protein